MATQLEDTAGVRRAGKMLGLTSLKRNLKHEDEAFADYLQNGANDSPVESATSPSNAPRTAGEDAMDILAGGDVTQTTHYHYADTPAPAADSLSYPSPLTRPAAAGNSMLAGVLKKAAPLLVGSAIGAAPASAILYYAAQKLPGLISSQPPVTSRDTVNDYQFGFGMPEDVNPDAPAIAPAPPTPPDEP